MQSVYVTWVISAVVLLIAAAAVGPGNGKIIGLGYGILKENRKGGQRISLTRFQITLWTIIVLSLLSGMFFARLIGGVPNPQDITIPNELLILMGISLGSTAVSTAVKANKDSPSGPTIIGGDPNLGDVIHVEEGSGPGKMVAIEKFQNFWFTAIICQPPLTDAPS